MREGGQTWSHITDVRLKVRDLDALREAAAVVGLEARDKKTYAWYGRFVGDSSQYGNHSPETFGRCEMALGVKGAAPRDGGDGEYEIGVVKAPDGDGYDLLYDSWGPGRKLSALAGENLARLKQEYAAAVAARRARETLGRRGFTVSRENLPNGRIRLRLRQR